MKKENRLHLLNMFRSDDQLRPNLRHNMEVDWLGRSWICTTNASALILIKDEKDINVDREAKTVNVRAILPDAVKEKQLDLDRLISLYNQVPMITRPVREECEACEGDGKFEHYGEDYDCKSCDEKGYTEQSNKETIRDPEYYLKLDGKFFCMDRFKEIHQLLSMVSPQKIFLLENEEKPALAILRLDEDIVVAIVRMYFLSGEDIKPTESGKYVSYEVEEVGSGKADPDSYRDRKEVRHEI